METTFWSRYGEAVITAAGFFWKSAWAFVLGYTISGMIQAFVPKRQLTRRMGEATFESVSLATLFGSLSSSCSFAALAAARSLLVKGAHFVATVAFMFASTNLVIELGILIWVFLGWQYLAAEIVGGLLLIAISSLLIRWTYPTELLEAARDRAGRTAPDEEDFDWRQRIRSRRGWLRVGNGFVMEWQMAWEDILIGFTIAGFMAVFVPTGFWEAIFLVNVDGIPGWLVALENAVVAPFVAAATFIGSMGNIPLATVLHANGVVFAGVMGFIYSDLMVPPLVRVNAKYYGWRTALYIAGIMFVSIVATALILSGLFTVLDLIPEGRGRAVEEIARFGIDYTFWLNLGFAVLASVMVLLNRAHRRSQQEMEGHDHDHDDDGEGAIKKWVVGFFLLILAGGLVAYMMTSGLD
jgi:uncharacterized membrane protein YraQ (UPF0718 family)